MFEWNVVISVHERGFTRAFDMLGHFGEVRATEFFNILVMKVDAIPPLLEVLREVREKDPDALAFLSRFVPVTHAFKFQSPEEFEHNAKDVVLEWAPSLAHKSFHVRIHRRGFKGRLKSPEEERFLDTFLREALQSSGAAPRITFDNPDLIIAVETVAQRAGLSLWSRDDLIRYPFIRLD